MKLLLIFVLLFTPLFAEEWTYLLHAREGTFKYDSKSSTGTLQLRDLNQLAGVFTAKTRRRVGTTSLSTLLEKWQGTPYGMVSYSTTEGYQSVPLKLEEPSLQGDTLTFQVKVLNGLGVPASTVSGETLLYIDAPEKSAGCLFPGDGWDTPACRHKL